MSNKNQDQEQKQHSKEELAALRHSAAHLLGASVLELWPQAKLTIGPSIDDGFYYDVDFADEAISEKDFPKIEKKMKQLVQLWKEFERHDVSKQEALDHYSENEYKQELINEFSQEGKGLSMYQAGSFKDLCRGGHSEQPSKELRHFKLLSVAGAYWRGDEKNKMLTRIYGTAFFSAEELQAFIEMREEAKKRDHKILGPQLDLFTFSDKVGSGLPLWTPKGTLLRNLLDGYVQELRKEKGYVKVEIPHITKKDLYETSGHWQKFADELFKIETREKHIFAMKPMNCPHHTQIFDRKPHSYREMPQRYANTTMVYRDEQSGELAGLSRVRCITQDDAHVFCRENQVADEAYAIWDIIETFYKATGFGELKIRLSLHDPENFDAYLGEKDRWEFAENQLRNLLKARGAEYFEAEGEAAFYGPKIDFMAHDSLGREWQVATIQIDRNMPERFELFCINEAGEKERVVMLHAAIMGSIERFLSILIEHHAGAFPVWLAPTQVSLLPIADRHIEFCQQIAAQLEKKGIRVVIDDSAERLSKKIRNAQLEKVPYMLVVGDEEVQSNQVGVRDRKEGDLGKMAVGAFVERVAEESDSKKA
jgi:threonyl-tRNA synthetase